MTDPPKWTIASDDDLSACAKDLWEDHGIASEDCRGHDELTNPFHKLQVHSPNPDIGVGVLLEVGGQLRLINGEPKVMSAEELAAWGVS